MNLKLVAYRALCLFVLTMLTDQTPVAFAHGGHGHGHGGHGGGGYSSGGYAGGGYGGGFYGGISSSYGYGYGSGFGTYYGNGYYNSNYIYGRNVGPNYYGLSYYGQPDINPQPYITPRARLSAEPQRPIPEPDGREITLFVAPNVSHPVNFTLNGQAYSLQPGEARHLTNDQYWTIEFPPTADRQLALRYTLTSGRYKFRPSGTGLGLFETDEPPPTKPSTPDQPPVPDPPKTTAITK